MTSYLRRAWPLALATLTGAVIVLSGFAIWKPVQLRELSALFGGYEAARYIHFFAMATIVVFLVIILLIYLIA